MTKKEWSRELRLRNSPLVLLLEWVTAAVLVVVLAALGAMVAADLLPEPYRLPSADAVIVVVLGLLTAALLLVSVLALVNTQDRVDRTQTGD